MGRVRVRVRVRVLPVNVNLVFNLVGVTWSTIAGTKFYCSGTCRCM